MTKGSTGFADARSFADLTRKQKRTVALLVTGRILIGTGLMVIIYLIVPIKNDAIHPLVVMIFMVIVSGLIIAYSLRRIERARFPQIRAVQVGMLSLCFYLFAFSALYLSLSLTDPSYFTVHLNHMSAFYFTVTVFTTVGFGDITPSANPTQLIVSLQMLLNLLFIYVGLRAIMTVGKRRAAEVRGDDGSTSNE